MCVLGFCGAWRDHFRWVSAFGGNNTVRIIMCYYCWRPEMLNTSVRYAYTTNYDTLLVSITAWQVYKLHVHTFYAKYSTRKTGSIASQHGPIQFKANTFRKIEAHNFITKSALSMCMRSPFRKWRNISPRFHHRLLAVKIYMVLVRAINRLLTMRALTTSIYVASIMVTLLYSI